MEITDIEELLLAASKNLRDYAYSLTHDWDRTDDLLQDTCLRILNKAHSYKDQGRFLAWARTIMHNAFVNNTQHEEHINFIEEYPTVFLPDAGPHSHHCDYDHTTGIKEIYRAIDNLPEKSATAMRLFISGHKYIEISVIMQIPIGTVKTRINKSRQKLKKDLKDYLN